MVQQIYIDKRCCLERFKPLKPSHDSPASFSTSRPQMIYLFEKCSIQPFMFSLERNGRQHLKRAEKINNSANISSGVRSPSLSSGWSIGVNISTQSQWGQQSTAHKRERARRANIKRLFRHTPRRIPPRKIPVHPILRGSLVTFLCCGNRRDNERLPGP
jgi:hypothetical protein